MIRRRLTFANVLSVIALFVALGGASYAATQLPKSSVGTKQLKASAVTAAKVRDGSLRATDFAAGQIPAGPRGPQGERGPMGERGDTGERGPRGESVPQTLSAVTRYGAYVELPGSALRQSYAACDPGEAATGGGYGVGSSIAPATGLRTFEMRPSNKGEFMGTPTYPIPAPGEAASGYMVELQNDTGSGFEFRAYAVCVKVG
jgi:hypothetical protein